MRTISLKMPESLVVALRSAAKRRGTSSSALIREAVEHTLSSRGGRNPSCLDLTRHLVGSETGPSDLSSNEKYMEDFGK